VYYALAFLSKEFEAYKTARFSFEKLNTLLFPIEWQEKIDYETLAIRAKPYTDKDNILQVCYRCLNTNPLINAKGDKCTTCSYTFIRSPISNEVLPLTEFVPKNLSDNQAIDLIRSNKNLFNNKKTE